MPNPWSYENPGNWRTIRRRILARDGGLCSCGAPALEVDHIIGVTEWTLRQLPGSPHQEDNLRAICSTCHARKTKAEAAAGRRRAAAAKRAKLTRRTEPHPGKR